MWMNPRALHWRGAGHVTIEVDLGKVCPISSAALRVLGGRAQPGLIFPRAINFYVSDDRSRWYRAGSINRESHLPPEIGTAQVVAAGFVGLATRGRFVAFHLQLGSDALSIDEIAIVRGSHSVGSVDRRSETAANPIHLGLAIFPDKGELVMSTPYLPNFLTILRNGSAGAPSGVEAYFDLPAGVRLRSAEALGTTPGAPALVRFRARVSHPHRSMSHVSRPLFFEGPASLPAGAIARITPISANARSAEVPLRSIRLPAVVPPRRIHLSIGWLQFNIARDWNPLVPALRALGFNAIGAFPRYWPRGVAPPEESAILSEARKAGMSVIYNESPFHVMQQSHADESEIYSQLPGTKRGAGVSPCYRGRFYREELARVERLTRALRPDWVFFDSELWVTGTRDADSDGTCRTWRNRGLSGEALRREVGAEIAKDLARSVESGLGKLNHAKIGYYAVDPMHRYQGLFDFGAIHPRAAQLAMPSLYVRGDPQAVHDRIRSIRMREPAAVTIPWLTAGTQGEFESSAITAMVLESLFNGARGVTYFLAEDFDTPEDFAAHARAVRVASAFEEFFVGTDTPLEHRVPGSNVIISTRIQGARSLSLVGNYRFNQRAKTQWDARCARGALEDAETSETLVTQEGRVLLDLAPNSVRVLHCRARLGQETR
jgi:hypothetical protein